MDQELAESVAQPESRRRSLEAAQRQLEYNKADLALQEVTFNRQNTLNKEKWVSDQALDEIHAKAASRALASCIRPTRRPSRTSARR
jgi:multidrug resistance efflux pump